MLALPLVTHGPFLFSSLLWLRTWYDQIQDNLALSSSVFLHSLYNQVLLQWLVEKRSNTKSYWQFMAETMGGAGEIAIAPPLYTQLYARHYARLYAWCMHNSMEDCMHDCMHNCMHNVCTMYAWFPVTVHRTSPYSSFWTKGGTKTGWRGATEIEATEWIT